MRNIRLTVSYDGTAYHGFQDQASGLATIQGCIEQAIVKLTGESLRITGAGRTDAGVHASGQVVNFYSEARIPMERWASALNSVLPRDIVVLNSSEVDTEFHARYSAIGKTYRYTIDNSVFRDVFRRAFTYHVREPLDENSMRLAAAGLMGKHDFAGFRSMGSSASTTVRTVSQLEVTRTNHIIEITVSADGFLYNMVRIISGTLIEVGYGKRTYESVLKALETQSRNSAGATAPPHGLCLTHVHYHD